MILFIKLLLAHLLGDFLFQSDHWVAQKEQKKIAAPALYLHIAVHGILALILTLGEMPWFYIFPLMLLHWGIDVLKIYTRRSINRPFISFTIDQILHIISLLVLTFFTKSWPLFPIGEWFSPPTVAVVTALTFLSLPAAMMVRLLLYNWTYVVPGDSDKALQDAGKYIGIIERILVFTFIMVGHWEAVGFLITAKSVFRFTDLKVAHDRKLTEYILIGTLLSFSLAIFTALTTRWFIAQFEI